MEEIKGDLYETPMESFEYLIDSFAAIERVTRRLLILRGKMYEQGA